jgi:PII-like signaling protein
LNSTTLVTGAQGFDHAGKFHSAGFFELADQPVAVTVSVDEQAYRGLMDALAEEDVDLSYVKVPVEFGRVGRLIA